LGWRITGLVLDTVSAPMDFEDEQSLRKALHLD
jgi:hypothetical protein